MAFLSYRQCFIFYLDGDMVDDVVGGINLDRGFSFGLSVDDVYRRAGRYGIEGFNLDASGLVCLTGCYRCVVSLAAARR